MTPTSRAQWDAVRDGTVPGLEPVRERLWSLGVPMPPGQRGLAYTLSYLLLDDDGRVHVVDPGYGTPENVAVVRGALEEVAPGADLASVIVTHLHADHIGSAEQLRAQTGASIVVHEREQRALHGLRTDEPSFDGWGVPEDRRPELEALRARRPSGPSLEADLLLRGDTDRLDIRGWSITALHTPGHTPGSMSLRLPELGAVLTGDHVLPHVFPGLGLGGSSVSNPVADYLSSLDLVAAFDDEVLPGHGYRFTGIADRSRALGDHHRRRTAEVAAVLERAPGSSAWDVAAHLTWSAGWPNLQGFFLYSALSQTALHIDLVTLWKQDA